MGQNSIVSASVVPDIILCPGCSGHGACNFDNAVPQEQSSFFLVECDCEVGWTGERFLHFGEFSFTLKIKHNNGFQTIVKFQYGVNLNFLLQPGCFPTCDKGTSQHCKNHCWLKPPLLNHKVCFDW